MNTSLSTDNATEVASRQSADVEVVVYIDDVNDNPPIFSPLPIGLPIVVSEDILVGTELLTISAMDEDSSPNAQVGYVIKSNAHNKYTNILINFINLDYV